MKKILFVVLFLFVLIYNLDLISSSDNIYLMGSVSPALDGTIAAANYKIDAWNSYELKIVDENQTIEKIIPIYMSTSTSHKGVFSTEVNTPPLNFGIGDNFQVEIIQNQKENGCGSELIPGKINGTTNILNLNLTCYILYDSKLNYDENWIPEPDKFASGKNIEYKIRLVEPYTKNLKYKLTKEGELIEGKTICSEGCDEITISLPDLEYGNYELNISSSDGINTINRYREFNVNAAPTFEFIEPVGAYDDPTISNNLMKFEAIVNDTIKIGVNAYDLNNDSLTYYWFVNGTKKTTTGDHYYFTPDELGRYEIILNISDGMINTTAKWEINSIEEPEEPQYIRSTTYSSVMLSEGYYAINYNEDLNFDITSIKTYFKTPNSNEFDIIIKEYNRFSDPIKKLKTLYSTTYNYFEIELEKKDLPEILRAEIEFKVKNEWLKNNKLNSQDIRLFRYHNNKWNELKTNLQYSDEIYSYYVAESPGFSYFAIGKYVVVQDSTIDTINIVDVKKESKETLEKLIEPEKNTENNKEENSNVSSVGVYLFILLLFLVGTLILMYLIKRNKPLY